MNNHFEQEIRYRLLRILSEEPALSQRDMAQRVGVSLGKVNYCISELAKRGFIKIVRFKSAKNKIPYTYILTPRGIQEKAKLTVRFLRRKLVEYEEIKHSTPIAVDASGVVHDTVVTSRVSTSMRMS